MHNKWGYLTAKFHEMFHELHFCIVVEGKQNRNSRNNIKVLPYKAVSKMSFVQIIQALEVLQNIVYNLWTSMSFLTKIKHKMKSPTHELLMGTQFWLEDWLHVPFYAEALNTTESYKNRNFPFQPLPPILSRNVQKKGQGNIVSLVRERSW